MKTQKKLQRRRVARRAAPLTLTQRVERMERELLFPKMHAATAAALATAVDYAKLARFSKLGVSPGSAIKHAAVRDCRTGLIWSAEPLAGGDRNWTDAVQAAKDCRLLGHDDWRLPTITELLSIVDYERWNPAVDPNVFLGPYGWTWSSTPVKGASAPAGCAWVVALYGGFSAYYDQSDRYHVRAVRAGQF